MRDGQDLEETRVLKEPRAAAGGLSVGQTVANRYELREVLGEGGMGAVFRAHDLELDEPVALKALRAELAGDASAQRRFRDEVRLARRITHTNVARIYELGVHGACFFLTMELVLGTTLTEELRRTGPFAPERAAVVLASIADGLQAVHDAGVVHRDVKPANVLLASSGRVVLTDFGIALLASTKEAAAGLVGTAHYMSPEQVRGDELTHSSDVYSLAVVAYELLTGSRPFGGESSVQVAIARLTTAAPDLSRAGLPRGLAEVVRAGMALEPSARPKSARDFGDALLRGAGVGRAGPGRGPAPTPASAGRLLAVLEIESAPETAALAAALREELVDALSACRAVRVLSPRAVDRLADAGRSRDAIAAELGASLTLEATLRPSSDDAGRARLAVRLVSLGNDVVLVSHREIVPEAALFAVSDRVVAAVSGALEAAPPARPEPSRGGRWSIEASPAALAHYVRGRSALARFSPDAVESFKAALALAPDHPLFLAGLASAQIRRANRAAGPDADSMRAARQCAERAIAIAPELAEAHLAVAHLLIHEGGVEVAVRALRRAVALSPSAPEAHALLGEILVEIGRLDEGTRRLSTALTLDAGSELAATALARMYALLGEWEQAGGLLQLGAHAIDSPVRALDARIAVWRRDRPRALELRAREGDGGIVSFSAWLYTTAFLERRVPEEARYFEEVVPASARRASLGRQILAEVHAVAGDLDGAMRQLEEAGQLGLVDLFWLERCPVFAELRGRPRYGALRTELVERADRIVDAFWG